MKLIVAGSRSFKDYRLLESILVEYFDIDSLEIVSGCARGADRLGEVFAEAYRLPVKKFPADCNDIGKADGVIRNKQMADYADQLLIFWDGESKGSSNMISTMRRLNKPVFQVRFTKE